MQVVEMMLGDLAVDGEGFCVCVCVGRGGQRSNNGSIKEGCQGPLGQQQPIWIIISAEWQTGRLVLNSATKGQEANRRSVYLGLGGFVNVWLKMLETPHGPRV